MQVTGTVVKVLPVRTGTSAKGEWRNAEYLVNYGDKVKKSVVIGIWGTDKEVLQEGYECTFEVDAESREYQGKYYTDVKAWKVTVVTRGAGSSTVAPKEDLIPSEPVHDLPF